MADVAGLAGLMASLKRLGDLVQEAAILSDIAALPKMIIEFQSVILAAQQDAFATQSALFVLLERIRTLETDLALAQTSVSTAVSEPKQLHTEEATASKPGSAKPSAQALCPHCSKAMKTTSVTPHPQLGALGIQLISLECTCGHYENKVVDPSKGATSL